MTDVVNIKEEEQGPQKPPVSMCLIPQANLQAVYDWLNSDRMMMPQNEVRQCLALLNSASLVEPK